MIKATIWQLFGWKKVNKIPNWIDKRRLKPDSYNIIKGKHNYYKIVTGREWNAESNGHQTKMFGIKSTSFKERRKR